MLKPDQKIAIFMEEHLGDSHGKMGYGILRFSPNPVVCVIDSCHAGKMVSDVVPLPRDCPVVGTVAEALALGAEAMVLGLAPSGGLLPPKWQKQVDEAVVSGLSIVNGLHDRLSERYQNLPEGQWVWDIRREPENLSIGRGRAARQNNTRVVMVGTDMANGKMTAGLLLTEAANARGIRARFVATGQIGISICGHGLPLDAVRVDYAAGAVEKYVCEAGENAELVVVEGQGSLLHPGSTATLPLLRGSSATHLILCHRAGQRFLKSFDDLEIPPLNEVVKLYEAVGGCCGMFPPGTVAAISLNTANLDEEAARDYVARIAEETGLPTTDPVRFGVQPLLEALDLQS